MRIADVDGASIRSTLMQYSYANVAPGLLLTELGVSEQCHHTQRLNIGITGEEGQGGREKRNSQNEHHSKFDEHGSSIRRLCDLAVTAGAVSRGWTAACDRSPVIHAQSLSCAWEILSQAKTDHMYKVVLCVTGSMSCSPNFHASQHMGNGTQSVGIEASVATNVGNDYTFSLKMTPWALSLHS